MVSIIIVNYKVKKELFECINSIIDSKPKTAYEIIVIDNDEIKTIQKDLFENFPDVIYIPNENKGFGQGNNAGASRANGEYLFFLNPDTKVFPNTLDNLINYLKNNIKIGILAPLLLDINNQPYQQGSMELTPMRALIVLSFINKLFPTNPISRKYFLADWDRKSVVYINVAPGTAFVIRKKLYEQTGGFDEKFFLYFEEFDFCNRIRRLGLKIVINPSAKVIHYWGVSTKQRRDIDQIFKKSRFYYFNKNYGILPAIIIEVFLRLNKITAAMLIFIIIAMLLLLIVYFRRVL